MRVAAIAGVLLIAGGNFGLLLLPNFLAARGLLSSLILGGWISVGAAITILCARAARREWPVIAALTAGEPRGSWIDAVAELIVAQLVVAGTYAAEISRMFQHPLTSLLVRLVRWIAIVVVVIALFRTIRTRRRATFPGSGR